MNNTTFAPTPTPITMAVWEFLGHLSPLTNPTSGLHWGVYARSGGPAKYIGRKG